MTFKRIKTFFTHNFQHLRRERSRYHESANPELSALNEELTRRCKAAEETISVLRHSEEQLRLILDSTAEAICCTDMQGNCTFCNSASLRLLGYGKPDDLIGKNMHRTIHHSRPDGTDCPEEECPIFNGFHIREGVHIDGETLWRADGSRFSAELWSFPQYRDGEMVGAVITFLDITRRTQVQEKLLKLSRAVENSPASVVITDSTGFIEYVNPKFTEITGYVPHEAIGRNPRILKAGVQSREFYRELWETILSGREWHGEFCNLKKDGSMYWEHASISPIRDERETITHFVAVKEDITERKRVAEELERAREAADSASRFKSEFLANTSHEIRTPLNAIIGFSALLINTDLSPRQRDFLCKINNAGEVLLRVINDILDFSKVEAGKLEMELARFRLDETLANVLSLLQQKAAEKMLLVHLNLPPDIPNRLVGDPFRLGQVLINLVGNAIKFTEKGSITITVTRLETAAAKVCLQFSVLDTGIGLSAEHLAKLFHPFTQADGSTTRKFGGSGLGLSISKRLVELMGGSIWAESELTVGSGFNFTAWFSIGSSQDVGHLQSEERGNPLCDYPTAYSGTSESTPDFSKARILLVEDNEINRQLAVELLKPAGAHVEVAVDGAEAIKRVTDSHESFDLVLMDIQMPDIDGYEATRCIRSDARFAKLPIIAMTAHAMQEEREKIMAAGMNDHITKPVNSRDMYRTMALYLDTPLPVQSAEAEKPAHDSSPVIPVIPGLDIQGALEKIEGDTALYLWILNAFLQDQEEAFAKIANALNDDDYKLAERIFHTTRGLAGNIGATALQELAEKLEIAMKNNRRGTAEHALLQDFQAEHERLLLALRLMVAPLNECWETPGEPGIAQ